MEGETSRTFAKEALRCYREVRTEREKRSYSGGYLS